MKIDLYEMIIDEKDDETGVSFNSFVDHPAHGKSFIHFNEKKALQFNEEKRIVTGVAISADQPIYRNDNGYEFYVTFSAETIEKIRNKMFKQNFIHNVNADHSMKKVMEGVYLVEAYTISNSDPKKPKVPEVFADQHLKDGSLIMSYYIENDNIWQKVKNGEWQGFSIEIVAELEKVNFNKSNKMSKPKKSFLDLFRSQKKQNFSTATTVDGATYYYDGELGIGTIIYSDEAHELVVTDSSLILQLTDGTFKAVELDGLGAVTEVIEREEFDDQTAAEIETVEDVVVAEVASAIEDVSADTSIEEVARIAVETVIDVIAELNEEEFKSIAKFKSIAEKFKVIEKVEVIKEVFKEVPIKQVKTGKFSQRNKPAEKAPEKMSWRELRDNLNKNK